MSCSCRFINRKCVGFVFPTAGNSLKAIQIAALRTNDNNEPSMPYLHLTRMLLHGVFLECVFGFKSDFNICFFPPPQDKMLRVFDPRAQLTPVQVLKIGRAHV